MVHMGLLSIAHPMLGQDAPKMPDGNALALFNDFGYNISEMSSNISRFLVTIARRARERERETERERERERRV